MSPSGSSADLVDGAFAGPFADRARWYNQGRPDYPPQLATYLREVIALRPGWLVADVGSGTGTFTRFLCEIGCEVIGVEPDATMRALAVERLSHQASFRSADGRAEHTNLASSSLDLVSAAQSFHWFDPAAARREFTRILRGPAPVVLVWNERRRDGDPFHEELESLLRRRAPRYARVSTLDAALPVALDTLFHEGGHRSHVLPNHQLLDSDALVARVVSSSYSPLPGQAGWAEIHADLRALHRHHASDGLVRIDYDLLVVHGFLRPATTTTPPGPGAQEAGACHDR